MYTKIYIKDDRRTGGQNRWVSHMYILLLGFTRRFFSLNSQCILSFKTQAPPAHGKRERIALHLKPLFIYISTSLDIITTHKIFFNFFFIYALCFRSCIYFKYNIYTYIYIVKHVRICDRLSLFHVFIAF